MMPTPLDARTLTELQSLIKGNFTGRDELYAAAESLDDVSLKNICRRLAMHLADNAIWLQQIVLASGVEPALPLETESRTESLFSLTRASRGESGVLCDAANCERHLKVEYDRAVEATPDDEAKAVLEKQREEVEFGEEVLCKLKAADPSNPHRNLAGNRAIRS